VVVTIYCSKCGEKMPDDANFCPKCGAATLQAAAQESSFISRIERDPHLQEHWIRRAVAYIIDSIIVSIATTILLGIFTFSLFLANPFGLFNLVGFPFATGLLSILYFPVAETIYGATLGKSLLGLRVSAKDGGKPSLGKAFIRNVSKVHWVLLLLDLVGGLLTSTDFHQKYSDRLANTTVT